MFTSSNPFALSASSTPLATAEAFSNATCIHGISHDVSGYGEVTTSRHPVADTATVFGPNAFSANLTAMVAPQPAHARCPGAKYSFGSISIILSYSFNPIHSTSFCGFLVFSMISSISLGVMSRPPNPTM